MSTGLLPDIATIERQLADLREKTRNDAVGHLAGNANYVGDLWQLGVLKVRVRVQMRNVKGHIVPTCTWVMNGRKVGYNEMIGEIKRELTPVQRNLPL